MSRRRGRDETERDVDIVRWVNRHGIVTSEQVGRKFFWRPGQGRYGRVACLRRLQALEEMDYIRRDRPLARYPDVIRVRHGGAVLAGLGIRPAELVLSELVHSLSVVALSEVELARHRGATLITARELRKVRRHERQSEQARPGGTGRCPDAMLMIPTPSGAKPWRRVAIEVGRVWKDRRSVEDIINAYDRELNIDSVLWFVSHQDVDRVARIVRDLKAEDRYAVSGFEMVGLPYKAGDHVRGRGGHMEQTSREWAHRLGDVMGGGSVRRAPVATRAALQIPTLPNPRTRGGAPR